MVRDLSMASHSTSHGLMDKDCLAAEEGAPCETSKVLIRRSYRRPMSENQKVPYNVIALQCRRRQLQQRCK